MNRLHLYLVSGFLVLTGAALFVFKAFVLDFPLDPRTRQPVWKIEVHVRFDATGGPAEVGMFIPQEGRRFSILDENFVSQHYLINTDLSGVNRRASWSNQRAKGSQNLFYRVTVRKAVRKEKSPGASAPPLGKKSFQGVAHEAAEALLADVRETAQGLDQIVEGIFRRLNQPRPDDRVRLLLGGEQTDRRKIEVAERLLAQAGIAARSAHGIRVRDHVRNAALTHHLEVFDQNQWRFFDPANGRAPPAEDFLVWWRGGGQMVTLSGGEQLGVSVTVLLDSGRSVRSAIAYQRLRHPLLVEFSLFNLPIHTQAIYQVLLMVPVGVLLLVFFRNVVGIRSFGTFMPVLIALAFRETHLLWGIVLFTVLVCLGLCVRLYLERLKLLVVPRLAAVLIVVILLMLALSLLTHRFGFERGLSVALFPMVILTMTIERISIVWDEQGPREALRQGTGSMLMAALAYLVMQVAFLEHLIYVFPELLLVLLGGTLLLGRYTGYRLVELQRFRELLKAGDK